MFKYQRLQFGKHFSERVELMRRIPIQLLVSDPRNPIFLIIPVEGPFQQHPRRSQ